MVAVRRAPQSALSFSALRSATGLDRDDLRRALRELAGSGFVAEPGAEIVTLASALEEAVIDALVDLYDREKMLLVIAITEISLDRLRNLAGRAFADAFVIRKKSGDDDDR